MSQELICLKCGKTSQKGGRCWDKGICAKCANYIYRKSLTCKECGAGSNHINGLCWKEGLCGKCNSKRIHPRKERNYSLCSCGEYLISMTYNKNRVYINSKCKVCPKCSVIYLERNNKFRLGMLI